MSRFLISLTVIMVLMLAGLSLAPISALAEDDAATPPPPPAKGIFELPCFPAGDCTLCDGLLIFVKGTEFLLKISGSLALAMFVYGGILFTFFRGNQTLVAKGRQILVGATIGLLLVLGAWQLINLLFAVDR